MGYFGGRYFFSADDWISALRTSGFSMGAQIHGQVAAILAGVRALPICVDKRMEGICETHKIPFVKIEDFDPNRCIEYYRDKADYAAFNKGYAASYDNFIDFRNKNEVAWKVPAQQVTKFVLEGSVLDE